MFKFGKRVVTLAIEKSKTNAFLSILEGKDLSSGISTWVLDNDKDFRVYEFEANDGDYDTILDELDLSSIKYKRRFTDDFGRDTYLGLI